MPELLFNSLVTPNANADMTLNGGINNSTTTVIVHSVPGNVSGPNFRIRVDDEIMTVTNVSGTTLTVTRATENSSQLPATSHADGAGVYLVFTSGSLGAWVGLDINRTLTITPNARTGVTTDVHEGLNLVAHNITISANVASMASSYIGVTTLLGSAATKTVTEMYGLYVEAPVAGANAAITHPYAVGFGGAIKVNGVVGLAPTDLATGTPTAGTFLRGDGAWSNRLYDPSNAPLILSGGNYAVVQFQPFNGATSAYIGADQAGFLIAGSSNGDMILRAENKRILFSIDAGASIGMQLDTSSILSVTGGLLTPQWDSGSGTILRLKIGGTDYATLQTTGMVVSPDFFPQSNIKHSANSVFYIGNSSNNVLQFGTNDTIRLAVRASGELQFLGPRGTGAGIALLGSNSPSSHLSAPYDWVDVYAADGTLCTLPIWQK